MFLCSYVPMFLCYYVTMFLCPYVYLVMHIIIIKKWETLKIEIPKKLYALCAILKDDTLHFVGGKNEKREITDSYFSIKTEELLPKNVGFWVFQNWIRKSGLKKYGKDVGNVVNKFVGAMDVIPYEN